jgi:hypothetical protein
LAIKAKEELDELLSRGCSLRRRNDGRWYVYDPAVRKAKLVSKELDKYCEYKYDELMRARGGPEEKPPRITSSKSEEGEDAETKLKRRADAEEAKRLREAKLDSKRPVVAKEIEDAAWFHNLLHDVGKYVYHKSVKYIDWTEECVKDEDVAFSAISGFVDKLFEQAEDAKRLQEFETENVVLEAYLYFLSDSLEKVVKALAFYKWLVGIASQTLCTSCRLKMLARIASSQLVQFPTTPPQAPSPAPLVTSGAHEVKVE